MIGRADDLDYTLTDTAGLQTVLIHLFGQTTLSDRTCLPDPERGALSVVVNYGQTSPRSPTEEAQNIIFGMLARAHQDQRPAEFPPITVSDYPLNTMPSAEAFSRDVTAQGVAVFRYALVFEFAGGAKGLVNASGPLERFEALRPALRQIGAGLRPRRNVEEMQQSLVDAFDSMIVRLRGPIVDQALDACLAGALTRDAAIARASAAGFPQFQAEPRSQNDEEWQVSAAPPNDSAKVTLALLQGPSRMMAGQTMLTCAIVGSPPMATLFRQRFESRFPGAGSQRLFTVSQGQLRAAGGAVTVGPGSGVGYARFESDAGMAAITIEVTPFN